jgi:copper homeostasis protein
MVVEVCLSDLQSALNASAGQATSIEICVDRTAGGVTPSYGLIAKIANKLSAISSDVVINVLLRPRDGDFIYSDDEFDIILEDIDAAKRAGAHGKDTYIYYFNAIG